MGATATATAAGVRHLKVRLSQSGHTLEPCEDRGCRVDADGQADCGRLACPHCGYSGSNLTPQSLPPRTGGPVACACGHLWVAEGEEERLAR